MRLKMQFAGIWSHQFEITTSADLRVGCYEGWTALRAWAASEGRELEPPPMLMLRNTFTRQGERWVVAGFTWPSTEDQLVLAPDPFRTKALDWDALFQRIRRAICCLAVAAPVLDGLERVSAGSRNHREE